MEHMEFSSSITFLNFQNYRGGKDFFARILGLELVYDIGWAAVYRVSSQAFLGAVDHSVGKEIPGARDAMLISLTTRDAEAWHSRMKNLGQSVSPIREVPDAGLQSFFLRGPEGFSFEIQQFLTEELPIQF